MLETIPTSLGYTPLGFCLALPCAIHTFVFLALSIVTLVIHLSSTQAKWMNTLSNRDRWGHWNPLHILFTIWYSWPVILLIALIVTIVTGLVAGLDRVHTLRLLLQVDSLITIAFAFLVLRSYFYDRLRHLRTQPNPAD